MRSSFRNKAGEEQADNNHPHTQGHKDAKRDKNTKVHTHTHTHAHKTMAETQTSRTQRRLRSTRQTCRGTALRAACRKLLFLCARHVSHVWERLAASYVQEAPKHTARVPAPTSHSVRKIGARSRCWAAAQALRASFKGSVTIIVVRHATFVPRRSCIHVSCLAGRHLCPSAGPFSVCGCSVKAALSYSPHAAP